MHVCVYMREYVQPPLFKTLNDYISFKMTYTNSAIMCYRDAKDVLAMLTILEKSNSYFMLTFFSLRGAISILDNLDSIKYSVTCSVILVFQSVAILTETSYLWLFRRIKNE